MPVNADSSGDDMNELGSLDISGSADGMDISSVGGLNEGFEVVGMNAVINSDMNSGMNSEINSGMNSGLMNSGLNVGINGELHGGLNNGLHTGLNDGLNDGMVETDDILLTQELNSTLNSSCTNSSL